MVRDWSALEAQRLCNILSQMRRLRIMTVHMTYVPVAWLPRISSALAKGGTFELWSWHELQAGSLIRTTV